MCFFRSCGVFFSSINHLSVCRCAVADIPSESVFPPGTRVCVVWLQHWKRVVARSHQMPPQARFRAHHLRYNIDHVLEQYLYREATGVPFAGKNECHCQIRNYTPFSQLGRVQSGLAGRDSIDHLGLCCCPRGERPQTSFWRNFQRR